MGQAQTLSELGLVQQLMGDYSGAAGTLEEALAIFDELGRSYAWRRLVYALTWEFVLLRWRLVSTSWSG